MELQDKTYVVSNAAKSLGRELSMDLAEQGANVILAGVDHIELDNLLEELQESSEGNHKVVMLEQSKEIDWMAIMEEIQEEYSTLNGIILVHTIFTENRSVYDVSFDEFNQVMYEHVWGTYLGIRTLRPMLKDERDAKIINVIEPSFEDVFERNLYYTVTGAIEALTHSTAIELRKEDVDVYALSYRPSIREGESPERSNPEALRTVMSILSGGGSAPTGETIIIN
ncbi:SDR family oxidoreductase [Salinicoccus carnicancri]|uniref:SDR family oxidoreductase n=1 Tax=Salinicoccus carnicancri TaxID=558170 RepID=UPI0002FDB615|nr:SDR family oxidoreductase [Salinicoccus carnicancri]